MLNPLAPLEDGFGHLSLVVVEEQQRFLLGRDLHSLELLETRKDECQHPTNQAQHELLLELGLPHLTGVQEILLQVDVR